MYQTGLIDLHAYLLVGTYSNARYYEHLRTLH